MTTRMTLRKTLTAATFAAALIGAGAVTSGAFGQDAQSTPVPKTTATSSFTPEQRGDIETIIREYMLKNPQLLQEVFNELEKRQAQAENDKHESALKENKDAIFNSPHQVVLGNPKGDVTLVEFFDYNCAYCKHALGDMLTLLKSDPKLRVVLKEFPVLSEGSKEAALIATAVEMQDPSKYLAFHTELLGGRGEANRDRALAVAKDVGLDVAKIKKDMASPEAVARVNESYKLATALGLNGTPSYVVGDKVIVGAVGLDGLRSGINTARCGKATC
jgi:protein-disulfide isomerase